MVLGEAVKQTHKPFVGLDIGSLTRTGPTESNELAQEVCSAARAEEVQICECWIARWVKLPKTAPKPGMPTAAQRPQGRHGRANGKTRRRIVVLVDLADGHAGKPLENSFQLALEPLAALHATTARQERLRRKLKDGGTWETGEAGGHTWPEELTTHPDDLGLRGATLESVAGRNFGRQSAGRRVRCGSRRGPLHPQRLVNGVIPGQHAVLHAPQIPGPRDGGVGGGEAWSGRGWQPWRTLNLANENTVCCDFALSVSVPGTCVGRSRTPRNNSASGCVIQPWSSSSFSLGCLDCLLEPFPLVRLPWSLQRPFQASATSRSPSLAFFPLPFHRPLFGPLG